MEMVENAINCTVWARFSRVIHQFTSFYAHNWFRERESERDEQKEAMKRGIKRKWVVCRWHKTMHDKLIRQIFAFLPTKQQRQQQVHLIGSTLTNSKYITRCIRIIHNAQ